MKKICYEDPINEESRFFDFFVDKKPTEFGNYEVTDEEYEMLKERDIEEDIVDVVEDGIAPFDISKYNEGMNIVTREGFKVRILCTDLNIDTNSANHIVYAFTDNDGYELIRLCSSNGIQYGCFFHRNDIFFKVA